MVSLVQYGKYGAINTTYTSKMVYYVITFVSEAYILQDETTCNRKLISAGALVLKAQYIILMQEITIGIGSRNSRHKLLFFQHEIMYTHVLML